jgi:hypothetical protein
MHPGLKSDWIIFEVNKKKRERVFTVRKVDWIRNYIVTRVIYNKIKNKKKWLSHPLAKWGDWNHPKAGPPLEDQ